MNLLKTIGAKGASLLAFPAWNWYKIAAFVVVFAAWTGFVHVRATHNCELKQEQQKTEQAEQKTRTIVEHVEKRVPVIQIREVESQALRGRVETLKGQLYAAIEENEARATSPTCNLSDAEYNGMRRLTEESTKAAK